MRGATDWPVGATEGGLVVGCRGDFTPEATAMTEHFVSCLQGPYRTGDVLVWQGVGPPTTHGSGTR